MTEEQIETFQKLAMSLDTCLELVAAQARKEAREEAGKSLRRVTWQDRAKSFPALVEKARSVLLDAGRTPHF